MDRIFTTLIVAGATLACGCAGGQKPEACTPAPAAGNQPGAKAVNTVCPIMSLDAADGTLTATYKGKAIAFCCQDCVEEFRRMDEAGKDAVLAKAMTYAK